MPCLLHTDPDGPDEHYAHPFMPCPRIVPDHMGVLRCPCPGGCDGVMVSEGRNRLDTLTFYQCDRCHDAVVVLDEDLKGETE